MDDTELVVTLMVVMSAGALMLMCLILVGDGIAAKTWSRNHEVCTCAVEGNRVEGCSDSDVRYKSGVVMSPTVSVRRHVHDEADME